MPIQRLYTGKDTGVTLPSGERLDRAQENMSKLILDADKMRYESFRKNEDWFLKTTDVPVESYLSTASTEYQAKLLDEYNKKSVAIVKSRGGMDKLTTEDKLELVKGKQFLQSEQQRMLGDQEKYKMAKQTIQRNTDKFDEAEFDEIIMNTYYKTGRYPDTIELPLKAKLPGAFFEKNKMTGTPTPGITQYRTNALGRKEQKDFVYRGTEPEAKSFVANQILNDPQLLKGAFKEFSAEPELVQWKYLSAYDTDKSGTLSKEEKKFIPDSQSKDINNPILKYAQDKYFEQVRVPQDSAWKGAISSARSASFNWNMGIGAGHNQNDKFEMFKDRKVISEYGTTTLPDFMNLGQVSFTSDPQQIQEVIEFDDNGNETRTQVGDVSRLEMVGYSPSKDILVVKAVDDGDTVSSGDILFLDASRYNDLLKRKPFGIDRESLRGNKIVETPAQAAMRKLRDTRNFQAKPTNVFKNMINGR